MINVSNIAPQTASPVSPPPQMATPSEPNPELVSKSQQPSAPQEPKKNKMFLIGGIILAIVAIGGLASLFLVQKPQDIRQQATQCKEECPSPKDGVLRSCTPADGDGTSNDSICNSKGRVESCGGINYCCPSPGGAWSTNMTPCATPTPEPSPTVVPGDCSTDSVAACRTSDPGDTCNDGAGQCTTDTSVGSDDKEVCTCADDPEPTPTTEPTAVPTTAPTDGPTSAPTSEPTVEPTSSSSSSSTSTSTVTVNVEPTQPPLPSELPQTGPEDWLKYLSAGLGAIGLGAVLFLFL